MLRYTLRQLEYFVAVGETGSIARASEKINISSPSISSAISQLEAEFGLPLFVRQHAQGLSLTQAGRQMHEQAKIVLRDAYAMLDIAGELSGSVRGPLSIGSSITFAQLVLPGLRSSFEVEFPDVHMRQSECTQAELFSALRHSEIDIGLTFDLEIPPDLTFTGLMRLPPLAIVSPEHPLAKQDSVTLQALGAHPMVLIDWPLNTRYQMSLFDQAGIKPNITERTRDMAVMQAMVGHNYGFSLVHIRLPNDVSPDGKPVKIIPIKGDVRSLRMGLVMGEEASRSHAARAFAEYTTAFVRGGHLDHLGGEALV